MQYIFRIDVEVLKILRCGTGSWKDGRRREVCALETWRLYRGLGNTRRKLQNILSHFDCLISIIIDNTAIFYFIYREELENIFVSRNVRYLRRILNFMTLIYLIVWKCSI